MSIHSTITVAPVGADSAVRFAAAELKKYLLLLAPEGQITVQSAPAFTPSEPDILWVGVGLSDALPAVSDAGMDDAILVDVSDFHGVITGANPRAVLIAVYRFLKALGIRFLRPGTDGEVIPCRNLDTCCVQIFETPAMRHRVVCIEGATSYSHVYDMIDWLPKIGMNGYFMQFETPYAFFQRWYSHVYNEKLGQDPFSVEDAQRINKQLTEEITRRGLMHHIGGHGWTCEPFGVFSGSWDKTTCDNLPEEYLDCIAMIDGQRKLFGGVPTNTQLCYSNPKVTETVSRAIADYCAKNSEKAFVHVWLADMRNNFCECEHCRDFRPTDLYIRLLNGIDAELTRRGIRTKLFMFSYNELSWPPLAEKLNNPDRYLMMFAPITRRFTSSFADADTSGLEEWPFSLNRVVMPRENAAIRRLIEGWDSFEVSDRVVYDYHLWSTDFLSDVGGFAITDVLARDIKTYRAMHMNGLISCQVQRCGFPNYLAMQIMADTLWDDSADTDICADAYLRDCYGPSFRLVREYLSSLSRLTAYWIKNEEPAVMTDEERRRGCETALAEIERCKPIFMKILDAGDFENGVQAQFWRFLLRHTELAAAAIELQRRKFSGESPSQRADAAQHLVHIYQANETELHPLLDVWRQVMGLHSLCNPGEG